MLAMCDKDGEVHASIPGLARRSGVGMQECQEALESLMAPDKFSRTTEHEGRRIQPIDGGWELLNHRKYRELMSVEERREYNRKKQAERRQTLSKNVNDSQTLSAMSAHTEVDVEAKAKADANTESESNQIQKPDLDVFGNPL